MDRMLYLGMLGARETALAQGVHTNNLANASTTGFRADLEHLQSLPVYGPGRASRVAVEARNPVVDFSEGAIIQTGRSLDVAVRDGGFIAVQAPDGSEAYTRAGDLRATSAGILTTGAGYPVLGEGGPIALPPATQIDIGTDGTITLRPMGQNPTELAVVDRIKLVNPATRELVKDSEGLFRMANGGQAPADADVTLISGAIEGSNVNTAAELVEIINLARQFEFQVKVMRTAEDNETATTEMMRMA